MMTVRYQRATVPSALEEQRVDREKQLWQYWGWTTAPAASSTKMTTSSSSSCSDCSSGTSPELADLVNSFYDGDDGVAVPSTVVAAKSDKDVLEELLCGESEDDGEALFVVRRMKREAEAAFKAAVAGRKEQGWDWGEATTDEVAVIKRKVMWALRQRGFDAGLCKSRPDKETCRFPVGTGHDYIDVLVGGGEGEGTRYVVELGLASEFVIARPTESYASLLEVFPRVFVGKLEALKGVVGIMCSAAAVSLKRQGMYVAPWRRREYVMSKWFSPYKRSSSSSRVPWCSSPTESESKRPDEEKPFRKGGPGEVTGMGGGGGGHWQGGKFGCREAEWERRKALVCLAGMYM